MTTSPASSDVNRPLRVSPRRCKVGVQRPRSTLAIAPFNREVASRRQPALRFVIAELEHCNCRSPPVEAPYLRRSSGGIVASRAAKRVDRGIQLIFLRADDAKEERLGTVVSRRRVAVRQEILFPRDVC